MTRKSRLAAFFLVLFAGSLPALAQGPPANPASQPPAPASSSATEAADAKARAYYHFTLAHTLEEMAGQFRRSAYLREAIEHYKEALKYDPNSSAVAVALADAYHRSGRIRQAVLETQELLKENPDNLAAHRLLGRIYFGTLGELEPQTSRKRTLELAIQEYEHITRLAPDDTRALLDLARLHRLNNDLDKAEAVLKKLLGVEPLSEKGLTALAALYSDQGDYQKAIALLQETTSQLPSGGVLASLAEAYEQAGDFDNAVETYRRALQRDNNNLEWRHGLAESLLRADRLKEALTEYRALAMANPRDAQSLLRLSQIYRHQRRYEEARAALEKAKELAPDSLEIGFNESLLEEIQGNFQAAITVLSDMLARMTRGSGEYSQEEKRTRGIIIERLGTLYRQSQDFREAADVFELLLPLGEEPARRGYAQLAETHRQARQLDAALADIEQALERFPDDRDLQLQQAMLLSDSGKLEPAVALLRSLLTDTPQDRRVYVALAQVYERHKRYPEAEAAIAQAETLSHSPAELEQTYFLRGAVYERQKKYALAEAAFRKVLEMNPESAITLNYLGYMFADQGVELEESVELVQRALELDPHNGAYLDSLGWAYFRLNQLEQAEDYLLRAVGRLSRDPTINDHLGDLYNKMGRLDLAEKYWERSREEWQQATPTEFDPEVLAKVEDKLRALKLRLARETPKKTETREK